jgi:putative NADPH-quinone reductase
MFDKGRMAAKILIINGHPDPRPERLCSALAFAYSVGARAGGHTVKRIDVGSLDFPLLETAEDFTDTPPPQEILDAQEALTWASHVVIIHPLWLGGMPARLKGFLEQLLRYGYALSAPGQPMKGLMKGRSVRVIITMGMPAPVFRWVFGAHGLKALERGALWICGFGPIRHTIIGGVGAGDATAHLLTVQALGERAR